MEKIVLAPDSFKGTMSASDVSAIMENEIRGFNNNIEVKALPIADGGEGTLSAFISYFGYKAHSVRAHNHLNEEIVASYGIKGESVIIEVAEVIGLGLKDVNDPYKATSYPVGELIMDAIKAYRPKEIILALGGSATNDLGIGALRALGASFYSGDREIIGLPLEIEEITGISLNKLEENIKGIKFIALGDVNNPLCGPLGATRVFGGQKGIRKADMEKIDRGFLHFNSIVEERLNIYNKDKPGAGAAGGLGYMVMSFLKGEYIPGIDKILEMTNFNREIADASLIITGEGKLDSQSLNGKAISKIASLARGNNKPLVVFCGINELADYQKFGITRVYEINNGEKSLQKLRAHSRENLKRSIRMMLKELF